MSNKNREALNYVLAVNKLTEPHWHLSSEEWLAPTGQYPWVNRAPDSFVRLVVDAARNHYKNNQEFNGWAVSFGLSMNKLGVDLSSPVTTLNRVTGERTIEASSLWGKIFQHMGEGVSWRNALRNMSENMKHKAPYVGFFQWMANESPRLALSKLSFLTWEGLASDSRVAGHTWSNLGDATKISEIVAMDKVINRERFLKFWLAINVLLPKTATTEEWQTFFSENSWQTKLPRNNRLDEKHLTLVGRFLSVLPEVATIGLLNAINGNPDFKTLHAKVMENRLISYTPQNSSVLRKKI